MQRTRDAEMYDGGGPSYERIRSDVQSGRSTIAVEGEDACAGGSRERVDAKPDT